MENKHSLAVVLLTAVFALYIGESAAQTGGAYPNRQVKIVVTLPPGGATDVVARLFAQKLSDQLKQPFIVENRPGGSQIPGADHVAKSAPDGYTLLLGNTSVLTILGSLYPTLPYDPQRDFAPVSMLVIGPTVLVVPSSAPVHSIKELIALAKAEPGKLNYASGGNGSPFHLSTELFKAQTETEMVHVPYKGNAPAIVDLLAGRVQLMFANVLEVLPHINSGKLRPLVVTVSNRLALLPDVPTMAEAGIRNAESFTFFPLVAPRATPKEVIATLNAEIAKAKTHPDVQQRIQKLAMVPGGDSLEDLEVFLSNEIAKWAKVIKASGAKVDN